ncbi:MAG TPA: anthranilate synthase component I family protein [Caulobacteraceae bacterium]|nr:anthranilate synthase component I family protein [Caulobacteraceae bacterium]
MTRALVLRRLPWREPAQAAAAVAGLPWSACLLSDGGPHGRWSYLAAEPDRTETLAPDDARDPFAFIRDLLGEPAPADPDAPPFQGGVIGLAAYELGARTEPLALKRDPEWPDLMLARYPALLAFDHAEKAVLAVGRGEAPHLAGLAADRAAAWLKTTRFTPASDTPAESFEPEAPGEAYEAAVAEVVARIGAGEIFQANIARAWVGALRPGADPFDLFARLATGAAAPFAAWLRTPAGVLVSNSPERFLSVRGGRVETRPIKGTRPRGADPVEDALLAGELTASLKDRAENLMIVDLMRNDLARVCVPGSVRAPDLFRLESYPAVHHLVSTVEGTLAPGRDAVDALAAAFPPGSITGAPKVQAMRVISELEPPRGPYCGSLFWGGFDGALDSSVLIRSAALVERGGRWRFRACAGAGIVADSDPRSERLETEAKIAGLRRALTEPRA